LGRIIWSVSRVNCCWSSTAESFLDQSNHGTRFYFLVRVKVKVMLRPTKVKVMLRPTSKSKLCYDLRQSQSHVTTDVKVKVMLRPTSKSKSKLCFNGRQSRSYVTANGQLVSQSLCLVGHQTGDHDQSYVTVRQSRVYLCKALTLLR
jgi:hypothetical protein